jgi:hypothetical protein
MIGAAVSLTAERETVDQGWGLARHPMAGVVNAPGRRVALVTACGGCGAQVRKKVFALCCRSCGAMLLQDSDLTERARPDALLPFAVEEETARAAFAKWIASRRAAGRWRRAFRCGR